MIILYIYEYVYKRVIYFNQKMKRSCVLFNMLYFKKMNNNKLLHQLEKIEELKKNTKYDNFSLRELQQLPSFNGLCELHFNNLPFYMINILNDDAVPLKYLWRNYYEELSAKLWFEMTRFNGYFFDVGAHTGIYSILGNLGKSENNIISIEPYFLNFSRLLSNLKINNIETKNCLLGAATNTEGVAKFSINSNLDYHTSGGVVSEAVSYTHLTLPTILLV